MSQNNNSEMNGMIFLMAILGAGFIFMAGILAVLLALFSAFMTVIALWAWNNPRVFMKQVILPKEARLYVWSGILGSLILPMLIVIASGYMQFTVPDDYMPLIAIVGYSLAANGIAIILAKIDEANAIDAQTIDAMPPPQSIQPRPQIEKPKQPFEFATWDDEERR
jgi:hypothetical protein